MVKMLKEDTNYREQRRLLGYLHVWIVGSDELMSVLGLPHLLYSQNIRALNVRSGTSSPPLRPYRLPILFLCEMHSVKLVQQCNFVWTMLHADAFLDCVI